MAGSNPVLTTNRAVRRLLIIKIEIMKPEQTGRVFDHLNSRYKITVYHGSNVMEVEQQIKLSWWKSLWRMDGQEYIWKRIYFGHVTPLEEFTKFYNEVIVRYRS